MKVVAPGKLLLTGAYAVLEGAPAIVMAVDRLVTADDAHVDAAPSREVRAAFGDHPAPRVEAHRLFDGTTKLGLGSSAAVLVAALGTRAASAGASLAAAAVRRRIFDDALEAHAKAQGGGSGVDVASCVHGGVLRYERDSEGARMRAVTLPRGLVVSAFFSGASARTSDLRARVDAFATRDAAAHRAIFARLVSASHGAAAAVDDGELDAFLAHARTFRDALTALGAAADAPIVPVAFAELALLADADGGVFVPSGAGGGDVGVLLAHADPSPAFHARASALGMTFLDLRIDEGGLRVLESEAPAFSRAPSLATQSPQSPGADAHGPSIERAHHG